jgi:hypothetical protein
MYGTAIAAVGLVLLMFGGAVTGEVSMTGIGLSLLSARPWQPSACST